MADSEGKAYGSAGTGGTPLAEGVADAVLTLLSGLLLAKGPFGVPGRLLLNEAGELDGPNSFRGAGGAVPDLLAGLSKGLEDIPDLLAGLSNGLGAAVDLLAGLSNGLGAGPDLLVGRSKTLFLVGIIGSVAGFSPTLGAAVGLNGSGVGSAGKIDFSSFNSTTP